MARRWLKLPNRIITQAVNSQFTHFSLSPEKKRVKKAASAVISPTQAADGSHEAEEKKRKRQSAAY